MAVPPCSVDRISSDHPRSAYGLDLRERDGFEPGLREISFQDMRAIPGLQAADLLAYEMRHFYDRRRADPQSKPRWPFMRIVADQTSRGRQLLKYLPAWYLEMQASADFEQQMGQLMRHPATAAQVMLELWPQF